VRLTACAILCVLLGSCLTACRYESSHHNAGTWRITMGAPFTIEFTRTATTTDDDTESSIAIELSRPTVRKLRIVDEKSDIPVPSKTRPVVPKTDPVAIPGDG